MPPTLTPEAVASLAPDPASLQAGKKLTTPAKWPTLAVDGEVLWGEAQGSGKHPYLVGVDLRTADIATKCSCPSRKFPCKHALGLMLMHAAGTGNWQTTAVPEELKKWLGGRAARAENKETQQKKVADPEARAKTQAKREKKMGAGLEALELWLSDLVREGILAARKRSYGEWDGQAARMVDAQLPGVARLVRQIPELLHEENGETLTVHLGRLYLLTQAWKNRESLAEGERADLLTTLGLPIDKAALEAAPFHNWLCVGSTTEEEGHLTVRRTWLLGFGGEVALMLDFAPRSQALGSGLLPLHRVAASVTYVPSVYPQRAVVEAKPGTATLAPLPARHALPLAELPGHWAKALAQNPWLERVGVLLGPVYLATGQVCSPEGQAIPLAKVVSGNSLWTLQAAADTELAYVFGEWNGLEFFPLSLSPQSEARG